MRFEYDREKSEANKAKHGIDFEEAQVLWSFPIYEVPTYAGNDAQRSLCIGEIDGKTWTAIITEREGRIRIISVRRSRDYETEAYCEYRNR